MVGEQSLPASFAEQVRKLKTQRIQYLTMHLALNEAPNYKGQPDISRGYQVQPMGTANFEEYLDGLTHAYRGHWRTLSPGILCSTLFDPTRAPAGCAPRQGSRG